MIASIFDWVSEAPILLLGGLTLLAAIASGYIGTLLRGRRTRRAEAGAAENQEGYIVSSVLGLLALMLSFTLAMAVERFDQRRAVVVQQANAIGAVYLRVQLLGAPHRARLSKLIADYADNQIALATALGDQQALLLKENQTLLTDLWAAEAAAFDSISNIDFSSALVDSMNKVVELDATRKAVRLARVPTAIFVVLLTYIIVTAGVLGYVLNGPRGDLAGCFLIALLTFALMVTIDLDRPLTGSINESQRPMERMRASLKAQPPEVFDRWRSDAQK